MESSCKHPDYVFVAVMYLPGDLAYILFAQDRPGVCSQSHVTSTASDV